MEESAVQKLTIQNSIQFVEKFKESVKGCGAYVDQLSAPAPYVFRPPEMTDFVVTSYNIKCPGDEGYDPNDSIEERIYSYADPVFEKDSKQGSAPVSFKWKASGQHDMLRAREKAMDCVMRLYLVS